MTEFRHGVDLRRSAVGATSGFGVFDSGGGENEVRAARRRAMTSGLSRHDSRRDVRDDRKA
jgi:hypothetical protein